MIMQYVLVIGCLKNKVIFLPVFNVILLFSADGQQQCAGEDAGQMEISEIWTSLDTSFCSYNAFHWTRNSYTSANDVTDKKLRARSIDRIPE